MWARQLWSLESPWERGKPIRGFPQRCLSLSPCPQREGDYRTLEQGMRWGHCGAVVEVPQLSQNPTRMERGSSACVPAGVQLPGNEKGWRWHNSLTPSYARARN